MMNISVRVENVLVNPYDVMVSDRQAWKFSQFEAFIGVPHCLDGSDEPPYESCSSSMWRRISCEKRLSDCSIDEPTTLRVTPSKRQNWRGILIAAFLLLIFVVFVFFTIYFLCRRCFQTEVTLTSGKGKNYATIFNFRKCHFFSPVPRFGIHWSWNGPLI